MKTAYENMKIFKNSSDIKEILLWNLKIKDICKGLSSKADNHPFQPQGMPTQLRIHQFKSHDTATIYYRNFL